jgi:hypothetical protein
MAWFAFDMMSKPVPPDFFHPFIMATFLVMAFFLFAYGLSTLLKTGNLGEIDPGTPTEARHKWLNDPARTSLGVQEYDRIRSWRDFVGGWKWP